MKSYSQALKVLKKNKIEFDNEYIESSKILNRVCAVNIYSKVNYPAANNSSFDGYAIDSNDTSKLSFQKGKLFEIIGTIAAGDKPNKRRKKKFQTVEIMTGGLLPKGFNSIIPVEQVIFYPNKKNPKFIFINKKIKKNESLRFRGSDYKKNDLIIKKETILNSSHILILKTLGITKIKVKKVPKILFFSSGNELTSRKKIKDWQVRNSNIHYIKSLGENFLFNLLDGGTLKDKDELILKKKIEKFINSDIDIIITCGALSAGKFDFVPNVVKKFKLSSYFKSVAIKPGKPFLFAKIKRKQKIIFGLPGNPISSSACFRFFVYPYLQESLGVELDKPIKGILKNNFIKKFNFTRFVKSRINTTKNGKLEVEILKGQESYKIRSLIKSNTWALLPSGKSKFKKGDILDCYFLNHVNKIF